MTLTHYSPDETDARGAERGAPVHHPAPSVRPDGPVLPSTVAMTNDRHRATLGHSETVALRSRKGRRTFLVTRRHVRWVVGADPVRETLALGDDGITGDVDGVRLSGGTLAAIADAWVRVFHPDVVSEHHGGTRQCLCDDLTVPALVLDRSNAHMPVYDPSTGRYDVREITVRSCHCGWQSLLGTDLGLSWQDMTPNTGLDYREDRKPCVSPRTVARTGRNLARANARRRDRVSHLSRAYGVTPRTPSIGHDVEHATKVVASRIDARTGPVTVVRDFPGVTLTVRTGPDGRHRVRLVRGRDVITFQARTAAVIARRALAI